MSDQQWSITSPQTIEVGPVSSLKLGMIRGRFEVCAHREPGVRIEVDDVHGDPVAVSVAGGRLEVRHQLHGAQGWFKNLMGTVSHNSENSAVIRIVLPAGVDVEAGIISGDGLVSGTSGQTRLSTVSGSVAAANTRGQLDVNTVSGAVSVRNHCGVLTAKNVSGEVNAAGDLTSVRANTVSGALSFDLHGFTQDFGANSVSGSLTITLPHDVGVDLIAKSASGSVAIDHQRFPHLAGTVETIAGPDRQLMLLRTNTVSGATSVLHRPAPEDAEAGH